MARNPGTPHKERMMNDRQRPDRNRDDASGTEQIDRHFLDENAEGEQEIIDAATRASETDRQAPNDPERRERSFGVDDPSHSRGSTRRRS
jgi:hypothetical protein